MNKAAAQAGGNEYRAGAQMKKKIRIRTEPESERINYEHSNLQHLNKRKEEFKPLEPGKVKMCLVTYRIQPDPTSATSSYDRI